MKEQATADEGSGNQRPPVEQSCSTPPHYDDFLFATIGEDRNETPLSVLSALTRLGLDPWQEAARLTQLPRDKATRDISSALAAVPGGPWTAAEPNTIAARLVELLPKNKNASAATADTIGSRIVLCLVLLWLIFATVWGAFVFETQGGGTSAHRAHMQVSGTIASRQPASSPTN